MLLLIQDTGAKKLEPVVAHTDDDTGDASNALDKNYKNDGSQKLF